MADDTIYAHAVGRIRTIERTLLDRNAFERMLESGNPEEAVRTLAEAGYGEAGGEGMPDLHRLLAQERKKVYSLLKDILPELTPVKPFMRKWDFHNAKVIIKGELAGIPYDELVFDAGLVPARVLKEAIRERNFKPLPECMGDAISESIETFNKTKDPQLIDVIMDAAAYRQINIDAKEADNPFLEGLFEIITDLLNIKTFLRIKKAKGDYRFLERVLVDGGTLGKELFLKHLDSPYELFMDSMKPTPYRDICEKTIGNFSSEGNLTEFERLSDDYIMQYIRKAKYIGIGMEPLVAYLVAREAEETNIRIIVTGLVNGISRDKIRERLRRAYV